MTIRCGPYNHQLAVRIVVLKRSDQCLRLENLDIMFIFFCLPFNLHIKKSKLLAEKRKEEADKHAAGDAKTAHKKMATMANRSSFKQFIL